MISVVGYLVVKLTRETADHEIDARNCRTSPMVNSTLTCNSVLRRVAAA
jgi:hypothetical protein